MLVVCVCLSSDFTLNEEASLSGRLCNYLGIRLSRIRLTSPEEFPGYQAGLVSHYGFCPGEEDPVVLVPVLQLPSRLATSVSFLGKSRGLNRAVARPFPAF